MNSRFVRLTAALPALFFLSSTGFAATARTVRYAPRDVINLKCKTRLTTLVVLPEGEKILDFVVGDRDYWLLEGTERYAYVKPAREATSTTINLITQAGNVYTFLAEEESKGEADVKVFVELSDPSQFQAVHANQPRYVPAEDFETLKSKLDDQAAETTKRLETFATEYPLQIAFDYIFDANKKPFLVSAIWHDDKATYIRARGIEKPALYEVVENAPVLINYSLQGNVYAVPKVLDKGRLVIGNKHLDFARNK